MAALERDQQQTKGTNLRRSHREQVLMLRRQRQSMQSHGLTEAEAPKGRFRKRDPHDCGKARCQLCHGEKIHGRPSAHQRRADVAFAQGLLEVSSD